jgi:hypothetical protein
MKASADCTTVARRVDYGDEPGQTRRIRHLIRANVVYPGHAREASSALATFHERVVSAMAKT